MPDRSQDTDSDREKDDRDGSRQNKNKVSSSSKAKDLSHVPCRFFKVGSCTAGSSCPFSHSSIEPGAQKDVCAWFVKGNCKFAHKCALAHVLPGQSMAMDRKNKKAAQSASNGGGTGSLSQQPNNANINSGSLSGGRERRAQRRDGPMHISNSSTSSNSHSRNSNPLLSGSTAPTRVLAGSTRPPITMPLKATISPSAPAPPLKDADFASFGIVDRVVDNNNEQVTTPTSLTNADANNTTNNNDTNTTAGGHGRMSSLQPDPLSSDDDLPRNTDRETRIAISPPSPLPLSTPTAPRRLGVASPCSPGLGKNAKLDFGPIGSPPRSSPVRPGTGQRVQGGFSPGTSPLSQPGMVNKTGNAYLSSSPFSAPGKSSVFDLYEKNEEGSDLRIRSGLATSLGTMRPWDLAGRSSGNIDISLGEEDLEELLPGSLTDLLTPEEKYRRDSRSHLSQSRLLDSRSGASNAHLSVGGDTNLTGGNIGFSRSVPSQSLLGSIWSSTAAEATGGIPVSPGMVGALGSGTPSSYKSASHGFGGRFLDENGVGMGMMMSPPHSHASMLAPSNASAAFLPGLQAQYLSAKSTQQGQQQGKGGGREGGVGVGSLESYTFGIGGGGLVAGGGGGMNVEEMNGGGTRAMSPPSLNPFANGLYGLNGMNGHRPGFDQSISDKYLPRPPLSNQTTDPSLSHQTPGLPHLHYPQNHQSHPQQHLQQQHLHQFQQPYQQQHLNANLSPGARALQAHAPGQSLPKGLGVGLSRIHVMPPLGGSSGAFSPPSLGMGGGGGQDWITGAGNGNGGGAEGMRFGMIGPSDLINTNDSVSGVEKAFSRLPYSAAGPVVPASTFPAKSVEKGAGPPGIAPPSGIVGSGRGYGGGQGGGPSSPLGGRVVTGVDDDDLFSMDG